MDTNERIVKFRLVTYFDEVPNQVSPLGDPVLVERYASMGEHVHLRPADEKRLDGLGALYSDEEAKAITEGTYTGADAALLASFRQGQKPPSLIQPAEGEGSGDIREMSTEQLADYIAENNLNVQDTLALLPEDADEDDINKLLDAEGLASENDPRVGVTKTLEARLSALNS